MPKRFRLALALTFLPATGQLVHSETKTVIEQTIVTVEGVRHWAIRFPYVQGIPRGSSICVEESVDLKNWTPLNPYSNRVALPTDKPEDGTVGAVTVRSAARYSPLRVRFLRVHLEPAWPGNARKQEVVTLKNVREHNDAHFKDLIPDNEFSHQIFDFYDREKDCQWARLCWTSKVDLTGIAWDNYWPVGMTMSMAEGVLISPRHVLMSAHTIPTRGLTHAVGVHAATSKIPIIFHDHKGKRIVRQVKAHAVGANDLAVVLLDEPVPKDLHIYKVLPARDGSGNAIDWNAALAGARALITTRERQCYVYKIKQAIPGPGVTIVYEVDDRVKPFYRIPKREGFPADQAISGDSGNPGFIFVQGEPVLLGLFWAPGAPGAGPFVSSVENFDLINSLMKKVGGTEQLTPALR